MPAGWPMGPPFSSLYNLINAIQGLTRLRSASFDFSRFKMTNKDLDDLGRCLKRLKYLKEIVFNFEYCFELSDIELEVVFKCLKRFVLLQKVSLSFLSYSKVKDTGLFHPSKSIRRLNSLQHATFVFLCLL